VQQGNLLCNNSKDEEVRDKHLEYMGKFSRTLTLAIAR